MPPSLDFISYPKFPSRTSEYRGYLPRSFDVFHQMCYSEYVILIVLALELFPVDFISEVHSAPSPRTTPRSLCCSPPALHYVYCLRKYMDCHFAIPILALCAMHSESCRTLGVRGRISYWLSDVFRNRVWCGSSGSLLEKKNIFL